MEEISYNESFEGKNNTEMGYCIIYAKIIIEIKNDLQSRLDELI